MITKIDDFIKRVESTAEEDFFTPRTFYHLSSSMFHEMCELLKKQEPVKAIADGEDSYICNNCGTVIGWAELKPGGIEEMKYKFCPECGRLVNWE